MVLADQPLTEGLSYGDVHKGKMSVPLRWAAALAPETFAPAQQGNCEGIINLTMTWDEDDDEVKVKLKGKNVLTPYPNVDRVPGVNFSPNPFFPETEDVVGGRYQLWLISPAEEITLFYSGATGDLLGSEHDLGAQPPGSFPVHTVATKVVGSKFFQPNSHGDVDVEFEWSYSAMVRLDRPEYSHLFATFPPPNTCGFNRFRYDLSTTRPLITNPRPASEARPFSDYYRNGFIFQITIEPAQYFHEPPLDTMIATYNNATTIAGLVPPGYAVDIDATFMNVAPPIKPHPSGGQCVDVFSGFHTKGLNFCNP